MAYSEPATPQLNKIEDCARKCRNGDRCKMSDSVPGWRCRHLIVIPDRLPRTERERGLVFSKVYSLAKRTGVLSCSFFNEAVIDRIVENKEELSKMIRELPPTFQL